MTPVIDLTGEKGTGPVRSRRPVYADYLPPCNDACPAGENVQAWLALAQAGRYHDAWVELTKNTSLPAGHGRVCYHPCESACNRQELDSAVSIHAVERFLGDLAIRQGWRFPLAAPNGKRVLVIGAGPCGLSAAYHLARIGYEVEIHDAGSLPGGMLHFGIPAYRLPREVLMSEIRRIEEMGVSIECNHPRQIEESEIRAQRMRVAELKAKLREIDDDRARHLLSVVDLLIKRSVAYDIGNGGLDHVLAGSRDVNVLVLDTALYSNTGGQASKSTPLGAIAKFASGGKRIARKDLALQAIAYGNVYVAQIAMGANPQQSLLALREAEAYDGPSMMHQQDLAVASGYWPLFRFNPAMRGAGENPFRLDSPRPAVSLRDYAYNEIRYRALTLSRPSEAEAVMATAQAAVTETYRQYEELASLAGHRFQQALPSANGAAHV